LSEETNNSESFSNLENNLAFVGLDIENIPLVIQFNKRDLKNIITEDDIKRVWEPTGIPIVLSSAIMGEGVVETFRRLVGLTYDHIDRKYLLGVNHGLDKNTFVQKLAGKTAYEAAFKDNRNIAAGY
jgi:Fe2+ transport system protein B